MNVVVKTPRENSYISEVPFYWNPFLPTNEKIRLHDLPISRWYANTTDSEEFLDTVPYKTSPIYRAECLVDHREHEVTTFDGATISTEPARSYMDKGCWVLISQDCSNSGLFTILSKKIHDGHTIKVLVPRYEVEFFVRESTLELKINDKETRLHKSEPIVIHEDRDESSPKLIKIEKIETNLFELKAYELGLTILIDLEKLTTSVKVSPWSMLQGQLCGLCGNNNQDPSDEYEIPSNLKVPTTRHVMLTHLVPSSICDVDSSSRPTEEFCRKESKHVTITRDEDGVEMTCTSEKKIPQCAHGCMPEETRHIKTCFTCQSESGISLSRKPFTSRWDEDVSSTCEEFYHHIEVPTSCVPAY